VPSLTHDEPYKEFVVATAVTTLVALAGLYLPVLGVVVSLFVPLPVLFYRVKLGRPWGTLILIAATFVVAFMMRWDAIPTTALFFELGLVGLVLAEILALNLSLEKTVAVTTGIAVAGAMVMLSLYGFFSAKSLWSLASAYLYENLELVMAMYKNMEGTEEAAEILSQSMEGIVYVMLRILPAIAVASILFIVWSNLLLARPLLQSRHLSCPDFGNLNEWRAPETLVWVVILSGCLLIVPQLGVKLLGVNGLIVMMMIYFFQGIAIVSFYFEKKEVPRILRGLLYGLIVLWQPALLLVMVAGLFDMWIDFRRIKKRGVEKEDEGNT
jgi:uncharacterized protein YybS (DUF2232 family)